MDAKSSGNAINIVFGEPMRDRKTDREADMMRSITEAITRSLGVGMMNATPEEAAYIRVHEWVVVSIVDAMVMRSGQPVTAAKRAELMRGVDGQLPTRCIPCRRDLTSRKKIEVRRSPMVVVYAPTNVITCRLLAGDAVLSIPAMNSVVWPCSDPAFDPVAMMRVAQG